MSSSALHHAELLRVFQRCTYTKHFIPLALNAGNDVLPPCLSVLSIFMQTNYSSHHTEPKNGYSSHCPLCCLLLSFQIESPHKCRTSDACLVDGAFVHVTEVLLILSNGLNKNDRHLREKFLETGFHNRAGNMYSRKFISLLLSDITVETHFVQRPLILTSSGLHDSCQE
ncbi:hypothetical protein C0J52_19936 [Blattella germanica]|nr:hypothetical protein C0J52_19936 [Blattella germanica]